MNNSFEPQRRIRELEDNFLVQDWMDSAPLTAGADSSVQELAELMAASQKESAVIVSSDNKPIGLVTPRLLLPYLLSDAGSNPVADFLGKEDFIIIQQNEPLLNVYRSNSAWFIVRDGNNKLLGLLNRNNITDGLSDLLQKADRLEHTAEILDIVLERAYEGVAVVDHNGIIIQFNDAYSRFIGIDKHYAIGRQVEEIIENTKLHQTIRTGLPERGAIQYINGQAMVVHRLPLWKNGKVVGAVGMLIFEGLNELYKIYENMQKSYRNEQLTNEAVNISAERSARFTLDEIIGQSESTMLSKSLARKVAKKQITVLITGESGTGKEMFAQSIHELSPFSTGRFVTVNCGAVPEHLIESELFGYEEGAFTGAKKGGKPGKFELAQKGTIFLDEIGEMPLYMQTKLLRVLQEREFERVGGLESIQTDARIIAASNRNLYEEVKKGSFREDLYYRINIVEIPVAPLRERKEDIPSLVSFYLTSICSKHQAAVKTITSEALQMFIQYKWEGNIRELRNVIENLVVLLEEEVIEKKHLPAYLLKERENRSVEGKIPTLKANDEEKEKQIIHNSLEKNSGNKLKTAKELGIHRTTLYQKLKKYNLK
ncbi:sigma 54-interacting transcriptional regulator [Marinococcus halophilus]|uniref:Sigma-54-dependent Fis family transcriptional regulator n=1 Tax=Marinococcus halophilus TaxID=1371 RepID=A0A510Y7S7_MARHA|nr:sigma 54-interacting transcriptional regulator [Marinococcus halophilus]GEK59223.1 sigma-54-dependent Fis family transcriptional regulator [Marinococcus halophilus]